MSKSSGELQINQNEKPEMKGVVFGAIEAVAALVVMRAGHDVIDAGDLSVAIPTYVVGASMGVDGLRRLLSPTWRKVESNDQE